MFRSTGSSVRRVNIILNHQHTYITQLLNSQQNYYQNSFTWERLDDVPLNGKCQAKIYIIQSAV